LHPTTLVGASLPDDSVDVVLSISTIEHFATEDLHELAREATRILRPGGHLVLTIDLFLDVKPFTRQDHNEYGTNIDVRELLQRCRGTLVEGNLAELHGYDQFDPDHIQSNLSRYMMSTTYPGLAQCLVARVE
jgi:ubiquinone/menaquinone biosynthesis C-methylase UbiE